MERGGKWFELQLECPQAYEGSLKGGSPTEQGFIFLQNAPIARRRGSWEETQKLKGKKAPCRKGLLEHLSKRKA